MKTSGFLSRLILIGIGAVMLMPGSAFALVPCNVTSVDGPICCGDGSVALVAPTNSPMVCLGDSVSVSADVTNVNSCTETVTYYDHGCDPDVTYGGDTPTYEVTWTATIGSYSTNGTGLTAAFTPTSCGAGTVSFSLNYTNVTPCNGTGTSGTGGGFTVRCDCLASTYATNSTEGSVTLTNATVNPTTGCLGNSFNASVSQIVSNAIVKTTTHYTNACGQATANCPDTIVTNYPAPTIVSNWWTISGPGSYANSGTGLSTGAFTPTSGGSGTVIFNTKWRHACDANTETTSTSATFNVSTNCLKSSTTTNCLADGYVTLINATMNPTNGCLGTSFSASAGQLISNAIVKITTHYTNACGQATANCPDTYVTNYPAPTIVSNWWVISGPGSYTNTGSGLSTGTFTPTNCGTGTVTFNLTYRNNNPCDTNVHAATPVNVSFTAIQIVMVNPTGDILTAPVEGQNQFTFSSGSPGMASVVFQASVCPSDTAALNYASNLVTFSIGSIAGSTLFWDPPANGKPKIVGGTLQATAIFSNLPSANSAFGIKSAAMSGCTSMSTNIEIFYAKTSSNHPGGQAGSPNWFYYWMQTSAKKGSIIYTNTTGAFTTWDNPSYTCYTGSDGSGAYTTPQLGANANTTLYGIDRFAWRVRHEWRHHEQMVAWWGSSGYDLSKDGDLDRVPDNLEAGMSSAAGGPFDKTLMDTYPNDGNLTDDMERNCVFTQDVWSVGSANGEDWGNPGMQHKTLNRYDD